MSSRHTAPHVPVVVLIALLSFACEDTSRQTRIGSPTSIDPDARFVSASVSVHPAFDAQASADALCPTHQPFAAPISLVFGADRAAGFSLSHVQMQFVDRSGRRGASMTILQPELVRRFGSTLIPRIGSRTFPFVFSFGCVGRPSGTLTIVVFALDTHGRHTSTTLNVGVE